MTPLRTAVIGVGALGRHHARILAGLPGVQLVGVVDSNQEQCSAVAADCGTIAHADGCSILDSVDAVSIAVPTSAHLAVATPFLRQGISVLVEKPLAPTADEGRQLLQLAQEHDCIVQVGHIERFNPAFTAALPGLGDARYIRAERVSPYTFRSTDIGVVLDLMIHDIDLVLSVVDSAVVSIEAFGAAAFGGHEDLAQARLRFENGCIADLTAGRVCPEASRKMQVWSKAGCTSIDFATRQVRRFGAGPELHKGLPQVPTSPDARAALMAGVFGSLIQVDDLTVHEGDALTAELSDFVEAVRHRRQPKVTGAAGLAAIETADRILREINSQSWDTGNTDTAARAA